jgi:hypothetical protein
MAKKKTEKVAEIEKLTPEQEAKIPEYLETYLKIGLSTEPCDKAKAEAAITASYEYQKMAKPEFVWVDSPFQGAVVAAQMAKGSEDVTLAEIRDQANKASYGSFEAYWVSFYAFIAEQLPVQKDNLIDIVKDIVMNCGVYWTFDDLVVICDKPTAIHMKDKKLHNPNGLALEYKNGDGIFALEGVRYPSLLEMTINAASEKKEEKF